MGQNLLEKVWNHHRVARLDGGQDQLFISLHLVHEVTSPQAFAMLRERGLAVMYPDRTFATVDHIVPTDRQTRPLDDELAEAMLAALEENTSRHGIPFFGLDSDRQGIVHIIGPELGLTHPGMTIACGDSHTATHGAFGAVAFGIGTSQIRDVLATQTLIMSRPAVRRINVEGTLGKGIYAKDIILSILAHLGVDAGRGYAWEYGGSALRALDMEGRMTICNMSIEGGARCGYVNPDDTTFAYLCGRPYAPAAKTFDRAVSWWRSIASDPDAVWDTTLSIDAGKLAPMVTWGINPGQGLEVNAPIPHPALLPPAQQDNARRALEHMGLTPGKPVAGTPVDVAFIGSCTNGRISDLREAARIVRGRSVAPGVQALVVPGSRQVARQAREEGLDELFSRAGFQWRGAGCSMCLAMNPDKLRGNQLCASSSNRNFIGRQGSPTGRTVLMSPAMVAAAAVSGKVCDVRTMLP